MYARTQIILVFLFSILLGQVKIGDWRAYTSPLKINKTIITGDSIICATGGGLLIKSGDIYNTLTTIDGLYSVDLSTLEKDIFGNFYGYGEWCVNNNTIYLNIGNIENTLKYSFSNEQLIFEANEDFIAQDWYDCCGGWTKIN